MAVFHYSELTTPLINEVPDPSLKLIVTIPSIRESRLKTCLESLRNAWYEGCSVEVIILINQGVNIEEQTNFANQLSYRECLKFKGCFETKRFRIFPLFIKDIPDRYAGVGLARKLAMDEASNRFEQIGNAGIITGIDADTQCYPNYFEELISHFRNFPKTPGASIHFEHPLSGEQFSTEVYAAICDYECHLRYFIQSQKLLKLPYAFHTMGSAMAVRVESYRKIGGMNKRKAGEDFYFIHKLIKLGGFSCITKTQVIPSPRSSDRVPFGTGKAVHQMIAGPKACQSYARQSFTDLEYLIQNVKHFYYNKYPLASINEMTEPNALVSYFSKIEAERVIQSLVDNSSSFTSFYKKFYQWFDAFKLMKYLHYARDQFYPDEKLDTIFAWFFPQKLKMQDPRDPKSRLHLLRELDKSDFFNLM